MIKLTSQWAPARAILALLLLLLLGACQGSSQGTGGPRPRSREAAGENANLPFEAVTSNRKPIDDTGGELEYKNCRLVVPRGAVDEAVFFEISIPETAPDGDIFVDSAYQLNPATLELRKDALLSLTYFDDDVPLGKDEGTIVIVQKVNNVWVELSNSKVYVHNNIVEAPIRFLGLYALRIASEDPRMMNTPPVASFEFQDTPYPSQRGDSASQANEKAAEQDAARKAEDAAKAEAEKAGAQGGATPEAGQAGMPGGPPRIDSEARGLQRRYVGSSQSPTRPGLLLAQNRPSPSDDLLQRREQDQLGGSGGSGTGTGTGASAPVGPPPPEGGEGIAVAEAEAPRFGPAPGQVEEMSGDGAEVTVYFSAARSSDPDGKIIQYDWDWDADGIFDYTSHSSPYAQHTFSFSGDYSVVLKVTDNGRYAQSGYTVGTVEVRNAKAPPKPLSANISLYPPFGPAPLTVHFAATVTGGTAPYIYKWTFSDGSQSSLPNPFTTYPAEGNYVVDFSVTDIKGERLAGSLAPCALSRTAPGSPQPRMQLDISPSVERGQAPYTARFVIDAERAAQPVTYRITFGDEAPGTPETVTTKPTLEHTYTNTGFYVVKVVATDAELRTGSTFATVHAYAPEDARDFTASSMGYGGDPFSFGHEMRIDFDYTEASKRTVRFMPANTPKPETELSFNWDFGDGTFATQAEPSHTFARDGVYEIRMTANDGVQRWRQRIWLPVSQAKAAVAIQRPPLVEGASPLKLTFDALVTRGEEPLSYDWSFGDVRRSDPSPRFTFTKSGETELKLTVKDRHSTTYDAPPVVIHVRPGAVDYRLPLAVISPQSGSTRAVVVDHSGANPVPMSSPSVDGAARLTDITANGQYMGVVTADGLLVRRIMDGLPVLSFLPAAGEIRQLRLTSIDDAVVAFVALENSVGISSWMVRQGADPIRIGAGLLAAVSGDGNSVILSPKLDGTAQPLKHYNVDLDSGRLSAPADFGLATEAALSRDGSVVFFLSDKQRLVRRNTRSGDQQYIGSDKDIKRGLVCSADGKAVAFSVPLETGHNVIYGRQGQDGEFRLASVTDRTGWGSQYLRLSADGRRLFGYGSREALVTLLAANGTTDKADASGRSPVDGEEAEPAPAGPPAKRERFGIIRLDLGASPNDWDIKSVNPRFVYECNANFATAGPFG